MKSAPKLLTGVRLGAVALACVLVAEVTSVLAHATVPGQNGQIVFRKALGHPARLAIVNADGTGYRMLPRAKGVYDGNPDWPRDGSTIVAALVTAATGHAGSSGGSRPLVGVAVDQAMAARHLALDRLGQPRVIVDRGVIARHRALAQIGQSHMFTDVAVIARHQALSRLSASNANGSRRAATTGSSGGFPWKESATGFAAVAACVLIGFAITLAGRVRARGAA
jgi:hypothetical protein